MARKYCSERSFSTSTKQDGRSYRDFTGSARSTCSAHMHPIKQAQYTRLDLIRTAMDAWGNAKKRELHIKRMTNIVNAWGDGAIIPKPEGFDAAMESSDIPDDDKHTMRRLWGEISRIGPVTTCSVWCDGGELGTAPSGSTASSAPPARQP